MASIRIPTLRRLGRYALAPPLRSSTSASAHHQRRWAQVHDTISRSLATAHPSHAISEKYRAKLEAKAQIEGHPSIDDLRTAYAGKIHDQHRRSAVEFPEATHIPQAPHTSVIQPNRGPLHLGDEATNGNNAPPTEIPQAPGTTVKQPNAGREPPFSEPTEPSPDRPITIPQGPNTPVTQPNKDKPPSSASSGSSSDLSAAARNASRPAVKGLDDIIDLAKARDLPDKELTAIWRLRHASSEHNVCAVVPAATYRAMEDAARTAPQFVLPVPHESQGAEIHFLQWTFDAPSRTSTVLFTQLSEFKIRGEFAQPHTTVTHHLDLADERGLVLMQGQTIDGRGVTPEQARWLVMCLQRFYGGWEADAEGGAELTGERKERAEERRRLLDWFSTGDERFTVDKLLEEAERIG